MPIVIPYCGLPPSPVTLLARWNLDPVLITTLLICAAVYLSLPRPKMPRTFIAGWLVTTLALISPICALSVSLFSARVTQHLVLTLIGAPLLAASLRPCMPRVLGQPLFATAVFALTMWLWHAPPVYDATFTSATVYWLMHTSMVVSAVWMWSSIFAAPAHVVLASATISTLQMGFLGALLTFAPQSLYFVHTLTTGPWGLTALEDQQLGGLIMWVPGCLVFLVLGLYAISMLFRTDMRAV
jgi:putative membrane protein